jgi:hypothetical protein
MIRSVIFAFIANIFFPFYDLCKYLSGVIIQLRCSSGLLCPPSREYRRSQFTKATAVKQQDPTANCTTFKIVKKWYIASLLTKELWNQMC